MHSFASCLLFVMEQSENIIEISYNFSEVQSKRSDGIWSTAIFKSLPNSKNSEPTVEWLLFHCPFSTFGW